jgi:NTE family protein
MSKTSKNKPNKSVETSSSIHNPSVKTSSSRKRINLALQGGGAHGAFAWGVLDYLLEDGRLEIEGVSATSAGAMNAVVLAQGLIGQEWEEARHQARNELHNFWHAISETGRRYSPFKALPTWPWLQNMDHKNRFSLDNSPFFLAFDFLSRIWSPYQFNPFNFNPLKDILEEKIDFERVRTQSPISLHLCATNVQTCKVRIFTNEELSADTVLASACLPFLFQAVEINGEYFWDGGYIGNPAIFPLIYHCESSDVVIVHINPIIRESLPQSSAEILNRLNEVSFNSSLMREMRAIAFVSHLIDTQKLDSSEMKKMHIHSIRSDETMVQHSVSSKLNTDWNFLTYLRDEGRSVAKSWIEQHYDAIGERSSIDIRKEFL